MTDVKIIKTEEEYEAALVRIEELMNSVPGSPQEEELELLALLVSKYEDERYPISPPDPVDAILFRMDQQGLSARDLIPSLGSQSRVSEVLNRKRPLSLAMIRKLHHALEIPLEVLIQSSSNAGPLNGGSNYQMLEQISLYFSCSHLSQTIKPDILMDWQSKVVKQAQKQTLQPFTCEKMDESFFKVLFTLSAYSAGPAMAREHLNKNGISLVIQKISASLELDGACFITAETNPIIGLTMRKNGLDDFWFTLLHLLSHLFLQGRDKPIMIFDSIDCIFNQNAPQEENMVNTYLKDILESTAVNYESNQYHRLAYDINAQQYQIRDNDINPELYSCWLRIAKSGAAGITSGYSSKKVSEELVVYPG
jgi:HTH-type transcriptional regulator/antitoxin HigA